MTLRNPGRLAIHRRSDEIAFLQNRLRAISTAYACREADGSRDVVLEAESQDRHTQRNDLGDESELGFAALARERDLADELLHTRQTEPLGETLQRRLAMAERICSDLALRVDLPAQCPDCHNDAPLVTQDDTVDPMSSQERLSDTYRVAEIERRALTEMLNQWWAWLRQS